MRRIWCVLFLLCTAYLSAGADDTLFVRGDVNANGNFDADDPALAFEHIFSGVTVPCRDAVDFTNNGALDISDVVGLLVFLYQGGEPPAQPFPDCGPDLEYFYGCQSYPPCTE